MTTYNTDVKYVVTQEKKGNNLEMGYVYFINVPVTYAQVHRAGKKYQSEDTAYQMNVFVDSATADKVIEVGINKVFSEVGVTKLTKGANRGKFKYPLEGDLEGMAGMSGASLTRETVKRDKKTGEITKEYAPLKVIDKEGNPFTPDVGNLSICTVKCFGYRNSEDMLNLMMDTVMVVDHVPYEGNSNDGYDDVMGVKIPQSEAPVKDDTPSTPPKPATAPPKPSVDSGMDDFDDDPLF